MKAFPLTMQDCSELQPKECAGLLASEWVSKSCLGEAAEGELLPRKVREGSILLISPLPFV